MSKELNEKYTRNKLIKFVSVSGCYWSGSSALLDLVKNQRQFFIPPEEFSLFSYGQFFKEVIEPILENKKPNQKHMIENIFRFEEFNKNDTPYLIPIRGILRRVFRLAGLYPRNINSIRASYSKIMSDSYSRECLKLIEIINTLNIHKKDIDKNLVDEIKEILFLLLSNVVSNSHFEEKPSVILFDQFVSPSYAESAIKVFPEIKMIFIDRDWRDQFIEIKNLLPVMMKKNSKLNVNPMSELKEDYALSEIDFFIKLRKKIAKYKSLHKKEYTNEILWLDFEDLVFNTKDSLFQVYDFLNLQNSSINTEKFFSLEGSKKNIGKWKNSYLNKELNYIERRVNNESN